MPRFRVQLKQGSRTIINRVEAKNQTAVLEFFNTLSTMQVSEIIGETGGYYKDDTIPPIDDFAYFPHCKFFINNDESRKSHQVIVHNLKLTKNENDIAQMARQCLEIQSFNVDSISSLLLKGPRSLS